ncbi:Phosphoglycerate dehydrogenase [Chitinophaga costaii]|uniref:Phosphoglycerate dehydrogenase n=1 Tax=Chitinophaga costaii TaxID=1335309 RepID=A0A1C4DTY4_9BACT|nr:D-2-hydroxyacid dehydrogenase family protein [Chitinophaga costaii]PUZ27785.1 D-2-hydroxyacid dehydrogenase family protein [Chitinophaga costaii]SCC34695.1 Phosphoglycerate dehydrogenase [Chitinophaga costaii]
MKTVPQIAVLDDYQNVALSFADWSSVQAHAGVTVFHDHIFEESALVQRLQPFTALCIMRERTPLPGRILAQLPHLKLIVSTGSRNAAIDTAAAEERGIAIKFTGYNRHAAPELTWALLMALSKQVTGEAASIHNGGWQQTVGTDLYGKTLGVVGLGNIGKDITRYAKAFGMQVVAWSQHLTEDRASAEGAMLVSKEELFRVSDFISIHLVLSERSRGIIGAADLQWMKPTAYFINTSRGPLVDETALITLLTQQKIAGAALDVFDQEPLPADHPFRTLPNVLATPHIGYVTENTYRTFFEDTVQVLETWLKTV